MLCINCDTELLNTLIYYCNKNTYYIYIILLIWIELSERWTIFDLSFGNVTLILAHKTISMHIHVFIFDEKVLIFMGHKTKVLEKLQIQKSHLMNCLIQY